MRPTRSLPLVALTASLLFAAPACADVKLPALFSDGMVLQTRRELSALGYERSR